MGCGRAVVSTPFMHAKEVITEDRGILAEFNNPQSFSDAIIRILSNPDVRSEMERSAYSFSRNQTWQNVALSYMKIFRKYVKPDFEPKKLPKIKFKHIATMTDKNGIIQFSKITKPDKKSGYTLDDNARALLACCMYQNLFKPDKQRFIKTYLEFIKKTEKEGRFYNYMSKEGTVNFEEWTEDPHGRTLWSLGYLLSSRHIPEDIRNDAQNLFMKGIEHVKDFQSPRGIAFSILGLYFCCESERSENMKSLIRMLADKLVALQKKSSYGEWNWFEKFLTYSNSKLSESLFYAYMATKDEKYLEVAEETLQFLNSVVFDEDMFRPIGQNGWYFMDGCRAHFDQQPVEASTMVQTLTTAYEVTKKEEYLEKALNAFHWYLGRNSLSQNIYDETTGGCFDGLGRSAININQGAESTLTYLIARLCLAKHLDKPANKTKS
jgi:hypothetical protein